MALTFTHECPEHGRFDVALSIKETTPYHPCPECALASPKRVVASAAQIGIPAHFRTTLPVTGLKDNQGRSGEWENLHRHFNRWDSGAAGLKDDQKAREAGRKRKAASRALQALQGGG